MEKFSSQYSELDLEQLMTDYAEALKSLHSESKLSSLQVLKILRSRDRIQTAVANSPQLEDDYLAKLVDLDLKLKQHSNFICEADHFEQLRQSLEPAKSAWWWYFEPATETPKPSRSKPLSARFDWLWNVGTVTCLVIATSFITQTAKAFSTEGFDFLGTLTTIGQGAGLAFIAGGALTDKGKQAVSQVLSSVKVPPSLHAEATFGASLMLLGAAYGFNQNLQLVGNWYFDQAQQHEKQGEWSQAFKSYQRALNFAPDDYKTQIAVGFLYERLGNFDQAIEAYKKGTAFGIPEFLNAQARTMLMAGLQKNDWQGGIEQKIIRDAEGLLDRADSNTSDWSRVLSEVKQNRRLNADIQINRAIAKMAGIKFAEKLTEKTRTALNEVVDGLRSIKYIKEQGEKERPESPTALTTISTLGRERAGCFYQKAFSVGRLVDSPVMYGIDSSVQEQDELNACFRFRLDAKLSTTSDAFLLRNYKFAGSTVDQALRDNLKIEDSSSLIYFIYSVPLADDFGLKLPEYADRVTLIREPRVWLNLSKHLSQVIQKNFVKSNNKDKKKIVWRLLLSKDGQILAHLAYNDLSRDVANNQPFIQANLQKKTIKKLVSELRAGGKLEFADFKVVLSPDGKVLHLLPWQTAYTTVGAIECEKKCKNLFLNPRVRSVFQTYTPDLSDPAELGALRAVVMANSYIWEIDTSKGVYYKESAIFKLKVSSDGQVIDYQANNQVAIGRLGKKLPVSNLKLPQFPKLQKAPYADFKFETRGLIYDLAPWTEEQ